MSLKFELLNFKCRTVIAQKFLSRLYLMKLRIIILVEIIHCQLNFEKFYISLYRFIRQYFIMLDQNNQGSFILHGNAQLIHYL